MRRLTQQEINRAVLIATLSAERPKVEVEFRRGASRGSELFVVDNSVTLNIERPGDSSEQGIPYIPCYTSHLIVELPGVTETDYRSFKGGIPHGKYPEDVFKFEWMRSFSFQETWSKVLRRYYEKAVDRYRVLLGDPADDRITLPSTDCWVSRNSVGNVIIAIYPVGGRFDLGLFEFTGDLTQMMQWPLFSPRRSPCAARLPFRDLLMGSFGYGLGIKRQLNSLQFMHLAYMVQHHRVNK